MSEEFALRFPLPVIYCDTTSLDEDLRDLLSIYTGNLDILAWMFSSLDPKPTPIHMLWCSNVGLHLSWARRHATGAFININNHRHWQGLGTFPVNVLVNYFLASCIFLGWPVDREVLKVQDKSYATPFSLSPNCSYCFF